MPGYPNRQRSERKWKITFLASFVAAANFLLMFATAGANTHLNKAEAEVERFRELMTAGKLVEIYSESTDELRLATSEKEFTDLLSAVRRKLGQFKLAERTNWFINYNTAGSYILLGFKTQYERGDAVESFTYRMDGENARLSGYRINSNALITN